MPIDDSRKAILKERRKLTKTLSAIEMSPWHTRQEERIPERAAALASREIFTSKTDGWEALWVD